MSVRAFLVSPFTGGLKMQLLFGGLISVVLLGVYVHLVRIAIKVVYCMASAGCTAYPATYFKEVPPLTTLGQAWLGLAVSAAYAYFGIKPAKAGT